MDRNLSISIIDRIQNFVIAYKYILVYFTIFKNASTNI